MGGRGGNIQVRLVTTRIAVAHADDVALPFDGKMNFVLRHRHDAALRVHGGNGEHRHVLATGIDSFAIRRKLDLRGVAGGFHFRFGNHFAGGVKAFRAQGSRRVFHLPAQLGIRLHRLLAERRAVQKEFNLFAVAEGLDENFLTFAARPVPVRREMQHGVRRPPRLVVIKSVLRKTARVENAEVRVDARPPIWRRLATIIKTGPDKRAGKPRPRRNRPNGHWCKCRACRQRWPARCRRLAGSDARRDICPCRGRNDNSNRALQ